MPALVSYWEGAILHFPLNQYTLGGIMHSRLSRKGRKSRDPGLWLHI